MKADRVLCPRCGQTFDVVTQRVRCPHNNPDEEVQPLEAPSWEAQAAGEARADLERLAAKHPDRLEFRDGRLRPRRPRQ